MKSIAFAQRHRHLIDGHSRDIKGMLLAVDLGNRRTLSLARLEKILVETAGWCLGAKIRIRTSRQALHMTQ